MKSTGRIGSVVTCLLAVAPFTGGASESSKAIDRGQQSVHRLASPLMAKITMRDGETRTVKLEGVGCTQSICSRAAIKAKSDSELVRTWFDNLAAIKDTTESDALFVMKDGRRKRMSLITDFRVLYLAGRSSGPERLDLGSVKSVEFLTPRGSK